MIVGANREDVAVPPRKRWSGGWKTTAFNENKDTIDENKKRNIPFQWSVCGQPVTDVFGTPSTEHLNM